LELALTDEYSFLDGLVYMNGCENMRRMADNWRYKVDIKFTHVLSVPQRADKEGIDWYKEELLALINVLKESFSVKITQNKLQEAVKLCNKTRQLLKEFYELRRKTHPPLSGSDAHKIAVMASAMPKEEYNELLEDAISEAKNKQGISSYRARIMVVGNMLDDSTYTEIIEEVGGLVVTDASCFGSLSFWELVELTKDPLDGIAKAYLDGVPCPRQPFKNAAFAKFLEKMVKDYNVDGIIFERMLHCSLWSCETLSLEKDSQDLGIPLLILEREYLPSGIGQLKTRIQAFIEMIEGGKR
jgi:benzoyl-CoA reductase/2-hydroxyglutaryl-CoA dehydratase subunit BcrC/BadD/HgdB